MNTVIDVTAALVKRDPVITKLVTARDALVDATAMRAKEIADVARAAEVYARRQQLGDEVIGLAHSVKIEALARLGELLHAMPKATGTRGQLSGRDASGGARTAPPDAQVPTYAALRLDKKTAMVAQQLAALPSETRSAIAAGETTLTEARRHVSPMTMPPLTAPARAALMKAIDLMKAAEDAIWTAHHNTERAIRSGRLQRLAQSMHRKRLEIEHELRDAEARDERSA